MTSSINSIEEARRRRLAATPAPAPVLPQPPVTWLLERWRPALATRTEAAYACAAAFLRPGTIRTAVGILARERAGLDLLGALTDLDRLFVVATGGPAPASLVASYLDARHAKTPPPAGRDRRTELPDEVSLERRLTVTVPGRSMTRVLLTPRIGAYDELERLRGVLLVARHAERVLGTPAHHLPGGELGFAVPAHPAPANLLLAAGDAPRDPLAEEVTDPLALPLIRASLVRTGDESGQRRTGAHVA